MSDCDQNDKSDWEIEKHVWDITEGDSLPYQDHPLGYGGCPCFTEGEEDLPNPQGKAVSFFWEAHAFNSQLGLLGSPSRL